MGNPMGIKSTSTVSRQKAYELLIGIIPQLTNDDLADVLDVAWDRYGNKFDNFIVRDGEQDDDMRFQVQR